MGGEDKGPRASGTFARVSLWDWWVLPWVSPGPPSFSGGC